MSAPYKIHEFTAISGNQCRLKVYSIQPSGNQPVDCTWETDCSPEDMHECDLWFARYVAPEYARQANRELGALVSTHIEDPDVRNMVIRSVLGESN